MQILPAEQTFGSTLGQALGQGFGGGMQAGLSSSLDQYFAQKKQAADAQRKESQLQKFFESPEGKSFSPEERAVFAISSKIPGLEGLGKELLSTRQRSKENQEFMDIINKATGQERPQQEIPSQIEENAPSKQKETGYSKDQLRVFAGSKNPQVAAWAKENLADLRSEEKFRQDVKKQEMRDKSKGPQEIDKENLRQAMTRTLELAEKRGTAYPHMGWIPKATSGEQREIRSEMDSLKGTFESALMPLVNKGTLAKPRFDFIISLLPQSDDTIETIRGKLKGLKRTLKTDVPGMEDIIPEIGEEKKQEKTSQMKKLTPPEGMVHMINPETGDSRFVPRKRVEDAKRDKYKVVQ